jgi:hypothetical protein
VKRAKKNSRAGKLVAGFIPISQLVILAELTEEYRPGGKKKLRQMT